MREVTTLMIIVIRFAVYMVEERSKTQTSQLVTIYLMVESMIDVLLLYVAFSQKGI